jgi:hypothetical protein
LSLHPLSNPNEVVAGDLCERDKTKNYIDGRYISAPEAFWRLMAWPTHQVCPHFFLLIITCSHTLQEYPPIMQLQVHLENEKYVVFDEDGPDVRAHP